MLKVGYRKKTVNKIKILSLDSGTWSGCYINLVAAFKQNCSVFFIPENVMCLSPVLTKLRGLKNAGKMTQTLKNTTFLPTDMYFKGL